MLHRSRGALALFVVGLVSGPTWPLHAQELRGQITGTVTDSSGGVLPGVRVTASSPALIRPQATVTAADGGYRFPALPSGEYAVTFEIDQFQTVRREGIHLNQDGQRRSALDLLSHPQAGRAEVMKLWPDLAAIPDPVLDQLEADSLYSGYLDRQTADIAAFHVAAEGGFLDDPLEDFVDAADASATTPPPRGDLANT